MGLPTINIEFSGKAVSAIKRSAMGIVALILKDDTPSFTSKEYKGVDEVVSSNWTAANLQYIKDAFLESPSKVIVEVLPTTATDLNDAYTRLKVKKFNYLAVPEATTTEVTDTATWIKGERTNGNRTVKAVLANNAADHEGIVNFTTEGIVVGATTYTAAEYTARIAGILASLPFTRSATYFVLNEVEAITEKADPDASIDAGELILVNDGANIKIGRGVNSLVSTTVEKTEDFKKIKILEVMDLVKDDVRNTFNNSYIGKVPNTYDNQVLFFTSVNAYFKTLAGDDILDPNFDNKAGVDVEAQRLAWEGIGTDTTDWDEQKVKETSFKSNVFAAAKVKIIDAMEDLDFQISI